MSENERNQENSEPKAMSYEKKKFKMLAMLSLEERGRSGGTW